MSWSPFEPETLMQGKQSILLSSALRKSKAIKATKAVTCKRKSNRTAKATKIKTKKDTEKPKKEQDSQD